MDLVPLVFSSGWASGVNAYLVVLVLGLAERLRGFEELPDVLGSTGVLVAAAVLYAVEFVADKIPAIDSTWDAISTAIRPTIAAIIAVLLSGDAETLEQAGYAVLGGSAALASHAVKAGSRLAINSSPEPFSNTAVSLGEDVTVLGVVVLAIEHPWLALGVSVVLLVVGLVVLYRLVRWVRGGWRRWKGRDPDTGARRG